MMKGEIMLLRRITEQDLPLRVMWMNNPQIYLSMNFVPPISLDNTITWHRSHLNSTTRIDVVLEDNGQIVAFGGLTNIEYGTRKAEFYVFVNPDKHGKGYGTKATFLICRYAFEILQLHKVYLYTNSSNTAAQKTYSKVGFQLEGVHRHEKINKGSYEDRLYYGILSSELDYTFMPLIFQETSMWIY